MNGSGPEGADIQSVMQEFKRHHKLQLEFCNKLEHFADGLPNRIDTQECLVVSRDIYPVVHEAHQFEESTLFPILRASRDKDGRLDQNLERLRFEHWEDESFAEEISDTLRNLVDDPAAANMEKLAYMLRGFFDGIRRHIAFEVEHFSPMLEKLG